MVLNSGKTRDLTLAAIARNIFMTAAQFDIFLKTVHIMGVKTKLLIVYQGGPFLSILEINFLS